MWSSRERRSCREAVEEAAVSNQNVAVVLFKHVEYETVSPVALARNTGACRRPARTVDTWLAACSADHRLFGGGLDVDLDCH